MGLNDQNLLIDDAASLEINLRRERHLIGGLAPVVLLTKRLPPILQTKSRRVHPLVRDQEVLLQLNETEVVLLTSDIEVGLQVNENAPQADKIRVVLQASAIEVVPLLDETEVAL